MSKTVLKKVLGVFLSLVLIFSIAGMIPGGAISSNAAGVGISYSSHVQDYGWQGFVNDGAVSGTQGQSKRLEGIKIQVASGLGGGISYKTHVQDIGWMDWVSDGAVSGTTGRSKRLEAIQIKLTGNVANNYDVYYRVHAQDYGWLSWAKNGESAGTEGLSKRLEAIEIKLVPKGTAFSGDTSLPFIKLPTLSYSTHIQDIGWQAAVKNNKISGTQGRSKRLEGIKISVSSDYSGSILYSTHVQDIGWMDWVSNGNLSGTTGKSKRLEAIKIKLTDDLSNKFDIYYRVHVQDYGWLGWAKNGEISGTEGLSKRLEAIQIQLVPKGFSAPGSTANASISKETAPTNSEEYQVYLIVNQERAANGLGSVQYSAELSKLANIRAKEIVELFSHTRPDGRSCFSVFTDYGVPYYTCGENIAAGYTDAEDVMEGWMNSEGHRANILDSDFGTIGVGYYETNTGHGKYWVQLFKD